MSEMNVTPMGYENEETLIDNAAAEVANTPDFLKHDTAANTAAEEAAAIDEDEDAPDENVQEIAEEAPAAADPVVPIKPRYIDSGNDMIQAMSPEIVQAQDEDEMRRAIRQHHVLHGRVIGIEPMGDSIKIVVRRKTMRVIFVPEDFFEMSVMKGMEETTSKQERVRRYTRKANRMLGAIVSFVPREVGYFEDTDAFGRTVKIPFVVASRAEALRQLQNRFFFHPTEQTRVTVNSATTASVLSAGPRYVIVEAFGVETSMGAGALSAYEFIEDAAKRYPIGSGIPVAVDSLNIDMEHHKVDLHVSHATLERMEAKVETVNESMINARYLATIVSVTDRYYHAILNGMKIRGVVPKNANISNEMLSVGDQVSLFVRYINKEQNLVIGGCRKM